MDATNENDSRWNGAKSCAEFSSLCGSDCVTDWREGERMNWSECSNHYLSGSVEEHQFNTFVSNHHRRCKQHNTPHQHNIDFQLKPQELLWSQLAIIPTDCGWDFWPDTSSDTSTGLILHFRTHNCRTITFSTISKSHAENSEQRLNNERDN